MGSPGVRATLSARMPPPDQFRYDGVVIDAVRSAVTCQYSSATHTFTEHFTFGPGGDWDDPAVRAAVRILFLLAGVSYYKTTAAPVIDLGDHPTTAAERAFLTGYYVHGLGRVRLPQRHRPARPRGRGVPRLPPGHPCATCPGRAAR